MHPNLIKRKQVNLENTGNNNKKLKKTAIQVSKNI